jgi:hypothetical protein
MHYDFKTKVNKLDSGSNRNIIIPEIDHLLNLALEIFVEQTAFPRKSSASFKGFEKSTRNIESIRNLVTSESILLVEEYFAIPANYWFYVKSEATCSKGSCSNVKLSTKVRQHDDRFEESPFDKSSFEWRELNLTFDENGIKPYSNDFIVEELVLTYIKKHPYLHNAEDYTGGTYTNLKGEVLTGRQDCLLVDSTHKSIVDIAVLIFSMNLSAGEIQSDLLRSNLNILN